jgi:RecB family exonuclease
MQRARTATDSPGIYDGVLGPHGAAQLHKLFTANGKSLPLDATRLKAYAQCPLKYFFREVLRLRSSEKLSDDFIGRESGTLLHRILERFTREYRHHVNRENFAEAWFVLSEIARYEIEKSTVRPVLRAAELRRLLGATSSAGLQKPGGILGAFLREEVAQTLGETARPAWSTPLSPHAHSEHKLPQRLQDSLEAKFHIKVGGYPVEGRFDRIDVSADGSLVAVVDYKTERSVLPDFTRAEAGLDFQLPLYLLAARELFDGDGNDERPALAAAYFHVREAQYIGGVGEPNTLGRRQNKNGPGALSQKRARELETIEFHTWLDETSRRIGFIGDLAARGNFNLTLLEREEAGCNWCDYAGICRRDDAIVSARRAHLAGSDNVYLPMVGSSIETESGEESE